jgi:(p)ppGpp synthase/HD superfamily hydrolase
MGTLEKAIIFAIHAHQGQTRKNGLPYIIHPLEVASIAATMTKDEDVLVAGILHDVIEDTAVTKEQLRIEFGDKITELVLAETENKRVGIPKSLTWRIRKEESLQILKNTQDQNVKIIWLSDKLANIRSLYADYCTIGDKVWNQFNQKDPSEHYWYYNTISNLLDELKEKPAWIEYNNLVEKVFHNEKKA